MSDANDDKNGTSGWMDLTVANADEVRDFYQAVVGWRSEPIDMGGYADYAMMTPGGQGVAGVCHARGGNAEIPPVWLIYWYVADIDASLESCRQGGGEVLVGPKKQGETARYAVIRDPGGAVCALYQR